MNPAAVLTALREELIVAALVRRPTEAGPANASPYPMLIEPLSGGPPAPGELEAQYNDHELLIVTAAHSGDLSEATGYEAAQRRRAVIDVHYRGNGSAALRDAAALDEAIKDRLIRPQTNYGYGFNMGTAAPVFVHACSVWGGYGPVSRVRGQAWHNMTKLLLEVAG